MSKWPERKKPFWTMTQIECDLCDFDDNDNDGDYDMTIEG